MSDQPPSACQRGPWTENDPQMAGPVDRKRISSGGRRDLIECRQNRHLVGIERTSPRLEHLRQLFPQGQRDLFFGDIVCDLGDLGGDVGGLAEEDAQIDALEQIPRLPLEACERALDLRDIEQRIDQVFDQFAVREAAEWGFRGRERGHQQQLGNRRGGGVALGSVDLLGQCVAAIGDVAGDGIGVTGVDLADFLDRCLVVEVEMLKTDQEGAIVAGHGAADGEAQQADQGAGLLVAAIFGKPGDDVADTGVEGISLPDPLDEGLRRGGDGVHPLGLLQRFHVGLGNLVDPALRGKAVEQALADDLEHLAGVLLDRGDGLGVAVVVLREAFNQGP